ncbi:MAG: hypothetical protein ACFFAE_07420 [Candidatus Hodarchaeota archaeon]
MCEPRTRTCRNQVVDYQNQSAVFYCLVIKDYLSNCPVKCPYFLQGTPIKMSDIFQHNYELECPFLHLVTSFISRDERYFVCGKTGEALLVR